MSADYARPLTDDQTIGAFLEHCLGLNGGLTLRDGATFHKRSSISRKLRDVEAAVAHVAPQDTLSRISCRDEAYRTETARKDLRLQILGELCHIERLENDEEITLGAGGAKPRGTEPLADRKAYIVTGLPASGKSLLVSAIADQLGAMIVDSDYAKRKLPEFDGHAGAQAVHAESALIVEGGDVGSEEQQQPSLIGFCKRQGFNIVMPKIGHDAESLTHLRDALLEASYEVHLTTIELPRGQAALRALTRFYETERYVPLGRIFDTYANDPALTYYRFRVQDINARSSWASFGALSSEKTGYSVLDCSNDANPAAIFRREA